ncbi:hypothetical protein BLNAU_7742 [Blattamonas nauphoetae]|uniref:Uncharacterized protein n=1 Tax=Blattamonas nauphoetae TaxID=2049346 RepID=A0ABQ9Y0Z3_9EUKA|nr:hypothetical protein BLNAU_7742 [Blattamonas nauphoetae]
MDAPVLSPPTVYESTLRDETSNVVFVLFQTTESSPTPIRLFMPFADSFSIEATKQEFLRWFGRQYTEQHANTVKWKQIWAQDLKSGELLNRSEIGKSISLKDLFEHCETTPQSQPPQFLVIMTFAWPDGSHPAIQPPQQLPDFGSANCGKMLKQALPHIARNILAAIDSSFGPLSQSEFPNYSKRPSRIMHLDSSKFMMKTVGSYRNTENLHQELKDILFRPSWFSLLSHILYNSLKFAQKCKNQNTQPMIHVVTGSPGIGKSALRFPAIALALSLGAEEVCTAKANEYPLRFVRKAKDEQRQSTTSLQHSEPHLTQTPAQKELHANAMLKTPTPNKNATPLNEEKGLASPNADNDKGDPFTHFFWLAA